MAKKRANKKENKIKLKDDNSKLFAWLATFLSIIGFIVAFIAKRNDKYVMYYASHSLVIFIIAVIAGLIQTIVGSLPIIGWIIKTGLSVLILVIWLVSWIFALSGEKKEMPLITDWAMKFKL
jgi:uncharacterized membrane protein